jgi:hypothetical protein
VTTALERRAPLLHFEVLRVLVGVITGAEFIVVIDNRPRTWALLGLMRLGTSHGRGRGPTTGKIGGWVVTIVLLPTQATQLLLVTTPTGGAHPLQGLHYRWRWLVYIVGIRLPLTTPLWLIVFRVTRRQRGIGLAAAIFQIILRLTRLLNRAVPTAGITSETINRACIVHPESSIGPHYED